MMMMMMMMMMTTTMQDLGTNEDTAINGTSQLVCSDSLFLSYPLDYIILILSYVVNKPNKVERIQNRAPRLFLRKPKHVSSTSLLRTLHWLQVKVRIQYKIACRCFQCVCHNNMRPYLSAFFIHTVTPGRCAVLKLSADSSPLLS